MQVKPNRTIVKGKVQAIHPEPDGWGATIELLVEANDSKPESDFIRPAVGTVLKLFSAEPQKLQVGLRIRAIARLNAGPTGGRAVLQEFKPLD